jgi:hypothetical protein
MAGAILGSLDGNQPAQACWGLGLAETAILLRLNTIGIRSKNQAEAEALEDALSGLSVLRRETVDFKKAQMQSVNALQPHAN